MPKLSAFPKCYMDELCVTKTMTLFDWIELAGTLGVDGVEVYPGFFQSFEPKYLQRVKMQLVKHGMEVPMRCSPPLRAGWSPCMRQIDTWRAAPWRNWNSRMERAAMLRTSSTALSAEALTITMRFSLCSRPKGSMDGFPSRTESMESTS